MFLINIIGCFFLIITFCLIALFLKSSDHLSKREEALIFLIILSFFSNLLMYWSLPVNILVGDI